MFALVFAAVSLIQHLTVDGIDRTYHVYLPASAGKDAGLPLVVVLHGGFHTAAQAEKAYGWDAQADRHRFVVVYPEGIDRAWNAGTCCGTPRKQNIDDVKFLSTMIERLEHDQRIDTSHIAIAGMSNGAMMAYRMACESPIALHAVGSVAGTLVGPCNAPRPTRVIEIHGLADQHVPFDGSRGVSKGHVHGASIPDVIAQWQRVDACPPSQRSVRGVVATEFAACANGTAVELITIAGAGHQWPDSKPEPVSTGAHSHDALLPDPPSTALDATETLYRFFFG